MHRIHISRHILFVHLLYFSHSHLATDNYRTTWFRFDQYLLFTFTLCNKIQITLFIKIPIIKIYCFFLCFIKNKIWKINYPITINSNRFKKNSILRATSSVSKFHMHHLIQIRYATVQRQNANGVVSPLLRNNSHPLVLKSSTPFTGEGVPSVPEHTHFSSLLFCPVSHVHARSRAHKVVATSRAGRWRNANSELFAFNVRARGVILVRELPSNASHGYSCEFAYRP